MEEKAASIGVILLTVVSVIIYFGIESKVSLYILVGAILIVALISKGGIETDFSQSSRGYRNMQGGEDEMRGREKKLLIFHILALVEDKKSIDMEEIATDLDVSIYKLNDIIRFLGDHGLVNVIYPPMKSFPILRESNPKKSRICRTQIYRSLAKKTILGKPLKQEFAKEVAEYLEGMRRKRDSKR
jgi:predicted transcriptional regulator